MGRSTVDGYTVVLQSIHYRVPSTSTVAGTMNGKPARKTFLCCNTCDNSYVFCDQIKDGTRKECKFCHQSWEEQLRQATWLHKRAGYKPKQPNTSLTPPWRSKKPDVGDQAEVKGDKELPRQPRESQAPWYMQMGAVTKVTHPNIWEACTATKESYTDRVRLAITVGINGKPAMSLTEALEHAEAAIGSNKGARAGDTRENTRISQAYDQLNDKMAKHKTKRDKVKKSHDRKLEEAEKDATLLKEMDKAYEEMDAESKIMLTKLTGDGISKDNSRQITEQGLNKQMGYYFSGELDDDKQVNITSSLRHMLCTDHLLVPDPSIFGGDEVKAQAHTQRIEQMVVRKEQLCQAFEESMAEMHALTNAFPLPNDDEEYRPEDDEENLAGCSDDDLEEQQDGRPNKLAKTDSGAADSMAQASNAHQQLAAESPPSGPDDETDHKQKVQEFFQQKIENECDSTAGGWKVQKSGGKKHKGPKGQGKGTPGKGGRGGQGV